MCLSGYYICMCLYHCRYFSTLLTKVSADHATEKPLVILLDSLDQLSPSDAAYSMGWLPKSCPENVYLIISTLTDMFGIRQTLEAHIPSPNIIGKCNITMQGQYAVVSLGVLEPFYYDVLGKWYFKYQFYLVKLRIG